MIDWLAQNNFFIYEVSFGLLAASVGLLACALRRMNLALGQPPIWIWLIPAGVLMGLCAFIHFYVFYTISPLYLHTLSRPFLIWMHALKTFSMASLFLAGLCLGAGFWIFYKRITR